MSCLATIRIPIAQKISSVIGQNCPLANNCPYISKKPIEESNMFISGAEGGFLELKARIRDMFKNNQDDMGHKTYWPQPAARLFAELPWKFKR